VKNSVIYKKIKNIYKLIFNRRSDCDRIQHLLKSIIKKELKSGKFFFIQIGSNDGKNGDPLFHFITKYNLPGILIEPIPYIFQRLKTNYRNQKNLYFENVAITNSSENLKFYRLVESPNLPTWHNQLGSFKREVIIMHKIYIPDIEKMIVEEEINVMTFNEVMNKYSISQVSLLHIDTEGYDYEILKSIDFNKYSIKTILFENKHLSEKEYRTCIQDLELKGFKKIIRYKFDTICMQI
jgi:FkbM family methyltransferase